LNLGTDASRGTGPKLKRLPMIGSPSPDIAKLTKNFTDNEMLAKYRLLHE